jgi:hypothetical protein
VESSQFFLKGGGVAPTGEGFGALVLEGLLPDADLVVVDAERASGLGDGVALLGNEALTASALNSVVNVRRGLAMMDLQG